MTAIRQASLDDRDAVHALHLRAFPESENHEVARLAVDLMNERSEPEVLSLVTETGGVVTGFVAFSPVFTEGHNDWQGYILAPLAVSPGHQGRGIGSDLVRAGIGQLKEMGTNTLLVYGDPDYYGRFGFSDEAASNYKPPYELEYPFGWQALELEEEAEGPSGRKISCVASLSNPELW